MGSSSAGSLGRRAFFLLGTSIVACAAFAPTAAIAQNECGAPPPGGGTVTCPPPGNPYPGGVNYEPVVEDLTVVLEPGVVVTGGVEMGSAVPAVDLRLEAGADTRISSSATGREGVDIETTTGTIGIDVFDVSTTGLRAEGIQATSTSGAITITSGTVSTQGNGSGGILAQSTSGAITITSGTVTTAGNTILGQPGVLAAGAHGIEARSGTGSITIDSTSITTSGTNANGIVAETDSGDIDITSGTITAADGRGIEAETVTGDINITSGSITTVGGLFSDGIFAQSESGEIVIDSGSVSVGNGVGIFVISGSGDVSITSDEVVMTGNFSPGIAAYGDYYVGGDISVVSGTVLTSGTFSNGIDVASRGLVSIVSNSIVTTGQSSRGIEATSDSGGVIIQTGSIATSGANSRGIQVNVYNEAGVVIQSGTITTLGDNGDGIVVATLADNSTGDFEITSGSISTQGDRAIGIYAYHAGSGDIVVTSGTITTAGDTQDVPYGGSHAMELHANTGSITVASTTIGTTGAGSFGILATSNGGAINITSGTVTTTGDGAAGIFAATGAGATNPGDALQGAGGGSEDALALAPVASPPDISITSTSVTTSGAGAPGIHASAVEGDIHIESGSVLTSGANSDGIRASSQFGSVLVDAGAVNASGTGSNAIVVTSATTSTVIVRGLVQSNSGFAVQADGGRAIVNIMAGGTIRGRIDLTDGNDVLTNAGLFDAIGTSQFGGGADIFSNLGTVRSINGAAVLASVDTFNNGGTIQMADGAANDRLTIGGTFHGQPGSTLNIDVNFDTGTADVLVTGLATGSTLIQISGQGNALGFSANGILVVDAGAGTQASAFTLAGGTSSNGYVTSGLIFDAANFDFLIVNSPNQPVFETVLFGEILTDLWYRGADAVSAQLDAARDGYGSGGGGRVSNLMADGRLGGWVQLLAGSRERGASQAFGTTLFDVGYEQDFEGVQAGFDHQSGPFILGITFGLGRSDAMFNTSFNTLEAETLNLGGYLAFASGSFFADAVAMVDWIDAETDPGAGLSASFDATAIGVRARAGMRFDLGGFWAEPAISLSWVEANIDDFASGGATIAFDDASSLRGSAGIRLGGELGAGSARLIPFVGIHAIEEFAGDNRTDFIFGSTLPLTQGGPGTHGEASAGITLRAGTLEAFVRGELQFGGDVDGRAARAGLRLRF